MIAHPPPPLHHYGDSNQGLSADGEDYEVNRIKCFDAMYLISFFGFQRKVRLSGTLIIMINKSGAV